MGRIVFKVGVWASMASNSFPHHPNWRSDTWTLSCGAGHRKMYQCRAIASCRYSAYLVAQSWTWVMNAMVAMKRYCFFLFQLHEWSFLFFTKGILNHDIVAGFVWLSVRHTNDRYLWIHFAIRWLRMADQKWSQTQIDAAVIQTYYCLNSCYHHSSLQYTVFVAPVPAENQSILLSQLSKKYLKRFRGSPWGLGPEPGRVKVRRSGL